MKPIRGGKWEKNEVGEKVGEKLSFLFFFFSSFVFLCFLGGRSYRENGGLIYVVLASAAAEKEWP